MSIININGRELDLGRVGALSIVFHAPNETEAAEAVKAIASFTGSTQFEGKASGDVNWVAQEHEFTEENVAEFTVFLPKKPINLDEANARQARIFAQQVLGEFV